MLRSSQANGGTGPDRYRNGAAVITDKIDERTVRAALELANRAPSVHNSQPWCWQVYGRTVSLHADRQR